MNEKEAEKFRRDLDKDLYGIQTWAKVVFAGTALIALSVFGLGVWAFVRVIQWWTG